MAVCATGSESAAVRSRRLSRGTAAAAFLAGAGACTAAAVQAAGMRAVMWGALAMTGYAIGLALLLCAARPGALAQWKAGPWMLIWAAAGSGAATLVWNPAAGGPGAEILPASVLRALCLVAVALAACTAAYVVAPGRAAGRWASRVSGYMDARFSADIRSAATPWLLYGAGTAARAVLTATTGRLGYVGNYSAAVSTASSYGQALAVLASCAPLGLATAALRCFLARARGAGVTLAILLAAELAYAAISGDKENYAVAVLAVVIPLAAARRRLPRALIVAAVALFLAVVIPFTAAYRVAARGAQPLTAEQAAAAAPGILRQEITSPSGLVSASQASVAYLLQRDQDIDAPAIIVQRTPVQIPYASPVQLLAAPAYALIPRALWPSKPILATGYEFGQQYYGLPAGSYTAFTITPAGDLYRHGGWIVVIAGMAVLGWLLRLLDDSLDARSNPHAILAVLLLLPALVMAEQDWVTLLADIPMQLLLWVAVVPVAFATQASSSLVPGTPFMTESN
jgi:hypothetical protein